MSSSTVIPYAHILVNLIKRNMMLRYKNSLLGYLWSFITPLLYLLIFHFVFSQAFQGMRSYSLYVLSGLILWQFFSNASNQCIQSLIANAGVIKTINVPIIVFPVSTVLTETFNMVLVFFPFFGLMIFFGLQFSIHTLMVIPVLILIGMFSLGLGLILGTLNVYLRDISILWNSINPALFYLTPVAYTLDFVPSSYHTILKLNPLFHFFKMIRDALYHNRFSDISTMVIAFTCSIVTFLLGVFIFQRLKPGIISNV